MLALIMMLELSLMNGVKRLGFSDFYDFLLPEAFCTLTVVSIPILFYNGHTILPLVVIADAIGTA